MTNLLTFVAGCTCGVVAMGPAAWALWRGEWRAHVATRADLSRSRGDARRAWNRVAEQKRTIVDLTPLADKGRRRAAAVAAQAAKAKAERKAARAK